MKQSKIFIPVVILLACIVNSCGQDRTVQDWPQYLGPSRNSTSAQKGILRSWPEKGPEVLWTADVGPGFGGPVVKDGRIYLLDRDDKVGDIMRCFDLSSGKELWKFSYDAPGSVPFHGSRSVPTVDGNYVYSCGHNGDLYCIDINTHKPIWNKNIWKDFGDQTKPPILYNGYFYAQFSTNSKRDGLVCMNMDGKIMWKTMRSPLFDKGSMILADGLILATDGKTTLYLIEPDPSGFRPLASAELLKEGGIDSNDQMASGIASTQNWAPLALADGRLLLRDQSRLMCVRVAR
jgi:hypothetical protein